MSHGNPPYKQGSGKFTSLAYKLLDIAQKVIHTIPSVRRFAIKSESAHIRRDDNANRTKRPETASRCDWLGRDGGQNRDRRNPGHDEAKDRQDPQRDCGSQGARGIHDTGEKDGSCQKGSCRKVDVMADVFDVAQYILNKHGGMTAMKLQKLAYYSQAWHIAWTDKTLFPNRIEAWKDGPVCPDLWKLHTPEFHIESLAKGDAEALSKREEKTIGKVLKFYGKKSPQWLSDLTHQESPWRNARRGIPDGGRSNTEITQRSMGEYYSSL